VDVEPLLSHVYDLDHTSDAFAALKGRDAIRPIIQI
jgi:Zn-dependent alcohol dehydrogenase